MTPVALTFDPDEFAFMGINRPVRAESDVRAVEVEGEIPDSLNGVYYRTGPDPTFPPFHQPIAGIDGNGLMTSFHFSEGNVNFRSRYVRTERYELECAANRSLFGAYRNPYSDDPSVRGANRGTGNTSMRQHAGILYALKEDSLGISIEPISLQTLGTHDFDGRVSSKTMTAHPKIDPKTGEMIFYGSAAKGETTPDVAIYIADRLGQIVHEVWFKAPYSSMVHDFAVTENWIVIPVMPTVSSLERMKAGGTIYNWEPERGMYLGLLPRRGKAEDIRWIHHDARWFYHVMNSYEENGKIFIDVAEMGMQPFPYFHADPMETWNPMTAAPFITRWTVDIATGSISTRQLVDHISEMPRIDERFDLTSYRHGFLCVEDPDHPGNMPGGPMNSIAHYDHLTGALELAYAGDGAAYEEPQFVPRSEDAPEGDGYLLALRHHHDVDRTEMAIHDTHDISAGPIAVIKLPFRTRPGVHGTWVPEEATG